ncbi:MAG: hypothetical protein LKJ44_05125 [Bifidobacteriaceae bacterium]|nr:hypothetical protein [Bifidobacteriaceae bacterium]MCI1979079.1 hypothetical protein [Bifidobacteriaceae bacterium]
MTDDDIYIPDFVRVLKKLKPHLPISDRYDSEAARQYSQNTGAWYSSQKEHMLGWFPAQLTLGAGSYTRQKPNQSARTTYNRLLSSGALLWIAEALGEDSSIVQAAATAALNEPNKKKRPALIRKYITWSRIAELARQYLR